MRRVAAIIVAAGEGRRCGFLKQFALLKGKPVLDWCLEKFETHPKISEIVLVLRETDREGEYLQRYGKIVCVAQGGERRQDSVFSGMTCLKPGLTEIVLVHDGVRPLISEDLIERIIQAVEEKGAAVPAIPVEDTIKLVEGDEIVKTLDREKVIRIQTPQGFLYETLKEAMDKAGQDHFYGTDEAQLVERVGRRVSVVQGDARNIKITSPEDLKIAEALLED